MKTEVISFFSDVDDRTYYSDHADRLITECKELGMTYDIQEKPSLGDYQSNCLSKPQYILDKLNEKQKPILWLDVDTYVHKKLDIFDEMENIDAAFSTSNANISGLKASPLYFNNTDGARKLIETWIDATQRIKDDKMHHFDHEPFFGIVNGFMNIINIAFVGIEYCTWPGFTNKNTFITMGLADSESKKESLRKMGMDEDFIEWQSPGNVK